MTEAEKKLQLDIIASIREDLNIPENPVALSGIKMPKGWKPPRIYWYTRIIKRLSDTWYVLWHGYDQ